jgi:hypothetical protein
VRAQQSGASPEGRKILSGHNIQYNQYLDLGEQGFFALQISVQLSLHDLRVANDFARKKIHLLSTGISRQTLAFPKS